MEKAMEALRADAKCRVLRVSPWIETKPYGGVEQEDFLNGAVEMDTLYTPAMLLEKLHETEHAQGRERKIHWGPRTLDLDILLYDDLILHTKDLTLPHMDMHNRCFVLEPLVQIAPYAIHPVLHKSVRQLYEELTAGREAGDAGARKETEVSI